MLHAVLGVFATLAVAWRLALGNLTRMVAAMTNSAPGDTQEGKMTDVGMDVDPMEKTMAEKGGGIRLPVSAKLIAGFGVVLLLTIVAGVMAISSLSSLNGDAQEIFEVDLESVLLVAAIEEEGLTVEELMTKGVLAALMAAEIHTRTQPGPRTSRKKRLFCSRKPRLSPRT